MTITARYIQQPRRSVRCTACGKRIEAGHIYAYGNADDNESPFGIRLHLDCAERTTDDRIQAALRVARQKEQVTR